jgi:hypothetical protein
MQDAAGSEIRTRSRIAEVKITLAAIRPGSAFCDAMQARIRLTLLASGGRRR